MAKTRTAGVRARTAGFYFGLTIHDWNRQATKDWLAALAAANETFDPTLPDNHPELFVYGSGESPWKNENAEDYIRIFGERRWPHCDEYTRGGSRINVEHITLEQVERLIRLGRIRRIGLTRRDEWEA